MREAPVLQIPKRDTVPSEGTSKTFLQSLGLSEEEIERIRSLLGREPTETEWGIFSVMWSEHCSYKNTKRLLAALPTSGKDVLQGPGENAGVVAVDEEWAVAFKVESHNHPSFVEPYQGAATGVGGILRDIFTMGARPIALLDSLHFGSTENDVHSIRSRRIAEGVVRAIADYGNCVGIPTVAGETHFDRSYSGNPLVNVMAVGVVKRKDVARAVASEPGRKVLYYGNPTGRDGVHGATMASETFEVEDEDKRINVQVGDPFMEKKILEATLELVQAGLLEAVQDMGAAGLTCSSCEMAGRGNTGIRIHLNRIPLRAEGLTPYEIMLSESQERMLAVVKEENWESARRILEKWDLEAVDIGETTGDGWMRVWGNEEPETEVAAIPVRCLTTEAPVYLPRRAGKKSGAEVRPQPALSSEEGNDISGHLLRFLASENVSSRRPIYRQYDTMVGTRTVWKTVGGDAAVLRLDGTEKGLAVTIDSNARFARHDPFRASEYAVIEAARNIAAVGARPLAVTNCLNYGDPGNPERFEEIAAGVEGLGYACARIGTPVTGGNVSLYNETAGAAILPTTVVGMIGIMDDYRRTTSPALSGDDLWLLGTHSPSLAGSEYEHWSRGETSAALPEIDYDFERSLHAFMVEAVSKNLLRSAHDISAGGIFVAAVEMVLKGKRGLVWEKVPEDDDFALVEYLLGEGGAAMLIATAAEKRGTVEALARRWNLLIERVASIEGDRLVFGKQISFSLENLAAAWEGDLEKRIFLLAGKEEAAS
ncbi:MAG: phosphoribosylformylglycinamidine synthase subunit PurL [Candidatus Hydrogenedentota bacterium]|nr:MAG: phosphoribosylformylglycinamidine synthase subunit PurL [Candidatus Hydrogenedentota bacterium]